MVPKKYHKTLQKILILIIYSRQNKNRVPTKTSEKKSKEKIQKCRENYQKNLSARNR